MKHGNIFRQYAQNFKPTIFGTRNYRWLQIPTLYTERAYVIWYRSPAYVSILILPDISSMQRSQKQSGNNAWNLPCSRASELSPGIFQNGQCPCMYISTERRWTRLKQGLQCQDIITPADSLVLRKKFLHSSRTLRATAAILYHNLTSWAFNHPAWQHLDPLTGSHISWWIRLSSADSNACLR
jgi:hypothetical protein